MIQTTARNATLTDLANLLKSQQARKVDVVASARKIRATNGVLVIAGTEAEISDEGVTNTDGYYTPTVVCDEGIAEKLAIPLAYLRRLRSDRVDLYDANVNGWLHGAENDADSADPRAFLVRCFRSDDTGIGVARAFLSDRYKLVDNLDVLTSALDGVKQAGVQVEIDGCDLTDRRMYVRIVAPEVTARAGELLRDYRSPFRDPEVQRASGISLDRARDLARGEGMGYEPGEEPIVFAGFVLSNSEVGGGAFSIVPRVVIKVCKNGLTITRDAMRAVHLGGRLDEGTIAWSEDTQEKNLALVRAKTRDAVASFLDSGYLKRLIDGIEEQSGVRVKPDDVKVIGKRLQFDQETIDGVLDHFVRGGDVTAGGVMNAVTSYAQTVHNADAAHDLEAKALPALEVAAAGV
jgi:hypothetical protein